MNTIAEIKHRTLSCSVCVTHDFTDVVFFFISYKHLPGFWLISLSLFQLFRECLEEMRSNILMHCIYCKYPLRFKYKTLPFYNFWMSFWTFPCTRNNLPLFLSFRNNFSRPWWVSSVLIELKVFIVTSGERGEMMLKASDENGDPDFSTLHLLDIYLWKSKENACANY